MNKQRKMHLYLAALFAATTSSHALAAEPVSLDGRQLAQQDTQATPYEPPYEPEAAGASSVPRDTARAGGEADLGDTLDQLREAASVVKEMESEPRLKKLMQQSKGIFIMPDYARAGLGVGVRGGEGVMMANNRGKWSSPAFYNFGGLSVGALGGVEVGRVAMLLMTDKAVNYFMQDNKFSLDADAGLTLVNFTAKASANVGRGDVIVWTDTKGAFASAAVGATDINFDNDENATFYRSGVTAREIIKGKVSNRKADALIAAMPKPGGTATGASTGATGGDVSTDDPNPAESIEAK